MILIPYEKYSSLVNNKDYTKPDYRKPKSVEPVCEVIDDDGDDMSDSELLFVNAIVQPLPKTYKNRGIACVTWDEDGVISTGKFGQIHISHISELIRDGIKS